MTDHPTPLRIDIVSDVVCPWCIVGYRQLTQALKDTNTPHEIHWHPFELNPQMPVEGQNLTEHIMEKYGSSRADSQANRDRLTELGKSLGFTFAFNEDMRMPNTFNAHQLLRWADSLGRATALEQAFFAAYFTDGRDLTDNATLVKVAADAGFDSAEATLILDDQRYATEVRKAEQFWTQQGISGVPAVIFDRQHLVTGAQGVDNYTSILNQLAEMAGTPAA